MSMKRAYAFAMSLSFPNKSRSFDVTRRGVRFWGHDRSLEILFFVDESALKRLGPRAANDEDSYLTTFDVNRDRIHGVAKALYSRRRGDFLSLAASDF
jgi:hypothetical protein